MHAVMMAINWNPEIRGITTVLIAFGVLGGSTYMLLGTNLGARLGLLVAAAGFFGWMALMGFIWAVYGIGLKGKEPTWQPKDIIVGDLADSRFDFARDVGDGSGWVALPAESSGYGQANASSDDILLNQEEIFGTTSEYKTVAVYDKGGKRWPKFGDFDYIAFKHDPHYAMVEVRPVVPQNTEPGKAPPTPVIDESQPAYYVLMIRDLGYRRLPALGIGFGSSIIFGILCLMLHRRDKVAMVRTGKLPALKAAT